MDCPGTLPRPAKLPFPGLRILGRIARAEEGGGQLGRLLPPPDVFGTRQDCDHLASMEGRGSGGAGAQAGSFWGKSQSALGTLGVSRPLEGLGEPSGAARERRSWKRHK